MSKGNKICLSIIIICTVLVVGLCAYAIMNHKSDKVTDAIKFKEEYEAYNGKVNESNDENYLNVDISRENPMVYKTGKEIVDIMKNEDAVIYFGFARCPWCRNIVEPLLKASQNEKVDKIYYVDIYNIRDSYEFTGSIVPTQTQKGTDAYYEILKILDKNLEEYYIEDDSKNEYDTGVKRLYAPTVVAISKGKVKAFHEGTLEAQEDPYTALTDKQKEELTKTYEDLMKSVNTKVCKDDKAC